MSNNDLIASVIWSGVAVFGLWRLDLLARLYLCQNVSRGTKQPGSDSARVEIPNDLEALAMSESEAFAQDDVRTVIREKFTELGDWQKVRRAMGIGELP